MVAVDKVLEILSHRENLIHFLLFGSFVALSVRSFSQEKDIKALEAEKEDLKQQNKVIKNIMWDWKQQLYSDAEQTSFPVPLSKIRSIYGELPTQGTDSPESVVVESSSSTPKFVV